MELTSRSFQVYPLTVAEACSGMRLLMAFFALGVATAYLETRPVWQRVVLVAAALPIAVFCNLLRVAITCTMYFIDQPEMGKGVLHTFTGMLMLIPAFAMLYLVGWVLNRFLVTEAEGSAEAPEGTPVRPEERP
jgi:exosortase